MYRQSYLKMYISKSRFINWTRCPMYFPMDLKHNPTGKVDIDEERERREERLRELVDGMTESTMGGAEFSEDDEEKFDSASSPELEAMLPYYDQVEAEALKVAKKYFHGKFISQKLFEYTLHGHTYRCYVDICNENENEINIIEVKATTNRKYIVKPNKDGKLEGLMFSDVPPRKRGGNKYPLFVKEGNIWKLNFSQSKVTEDASKNFDEKKKNLLNRYREEGKYPHDLAFQRFVIEHSLRQSGDNRPVNYYLAVLNSEYVYDGAMDDNGKCIYNTIDGQEIITFIDLNETTKAYQTKILEEIAYLESYISTPHNVDNKVYVGKHCAWGENTECLFYKHCFEKLRNVPRTNRANNYVYCQGKFKEGNIENKYQLVNEGYWRFDDVPEAWLIKENHITQVKNFSTFLCRSIQKRHEFGLAEIIPVICISAFWGQFSP